MARRIRSISWGELSAPQLFDQFLGADQPISIRGLAEVVQKQTIHAAGQPICGFVLAAEVDGDAARVEASQLLSQRLTAALRVGNDAVEQLRRHAECIVVLGDGDPLSISGE